MSNTVNNLESEILTILYPAPRNLRVRQIDRMGCHCITSYIMIDVLFKQLEMAKCIYSGTQISISSMHMQRERGVKTSWGIHLHVIWRVPRKVG